MISWCLWMGLFFKDGGSKETEDPKPKQTTQADRKQITPKSWEGIYLFIHLYLLPPINHSSFFFETVAKVTAFFLSFTSKGSGSAVFFPTILIWRWLEENDAKFSHISRENCSVFLIPKFVGGGLKNLKPIWRGNFVASLLVVSLKRSDIDIPSQKFTFFVSRYR